MVILRLVQLFAGLFLYGFSLAMMLRADLGTSPWNVLHEGIANRTPLSFGLVVNLIGLAVLLLWIPLRQKPGIGTISNVLVIGVAADLGLLLIPEISSISLRVPLLLSSILLFGAATAAYIGAGFGPGPRDGLMTGIVGRTGWPVKRVRMALDVAVLCLGWILGGTVGIGTVLCALGAGPIVHALLPVMTISPRETAGRAA